MATRLRVAAADPDAKAKLAAGAAAAGTDVQGLLDMAADSGIAAPPPTDGLTEVMTFEELGADLAASVPTDDAARALFFRGLTPSQQDALLARLACVERKHPAALAVAFNVPTGRLTRAIRRASERRGVVAIGARLSTVVGGLVDAAERAMEELALEGSWRAYFDVRLKLTAKLQDLGIVFRAPTEHHHDVSHTMDEATRDEVTKLVELERKQQRRTEEIKLASAQIVDSLPEVR